MTGSGFLGRAGAAGLAVLAPLCMTGAARAEALIEGVWLTPQQAEMTISACVEGFCGYITKVAITDEIRAKYGDGLDQVEVFTDYNNRDPALKARPIQNLQILTLRGTDSPWRFQGEIYSPEDGNTYAGELTILDADRLVLKGCALIVLCQEHIWTRVGAE